LAGVGVWDHANKQRAMLLIVEMIHAFVAAALQDSANFIVFERILNPPAAIIVRLCHGALLVDGAPRLGKLFLMVSGPLVIVS
jgi:hypothetical protein